jgi:hypothetical protein
MKGSSLATRKVAPPEWIFNQATVDDVMPLIILLQTADSKIVDRISIALSQLISILIRIVK